MNDFQCVHPEIMLVKTVFLCMAVKKKIKNNNSFILF